MIAAALAAGCTGPSSGSAAQDPTASASSSGVLEGYPPDDEALSPLLITALAPAPIPVTGTDGRIHVVYEVSVLNFSPSEATPTRLETLDGGPDGEVVAAVEGDDLAERTLVVAGPAGGPIPAGGTGLILVDDVYDDMADVPATFTHRLDVTFAPLAPEYAGQAGLFPGEPVSLIGGPVSMSTESPMVIGPPLAGADWAAISGCCGAGTHRVAMLPIGGRINGSERYAIDWLKIDPTIAPAAQAALFAEGLAPTFDGDPTRNDDYLAYDEPALAVADGTIVTVVSDRPDSEPGAVPLGLTLEEAGGNYVAIDIGDGVFAYYGHLVPGSPTVEAGDRVERGQVIGRVGNSGNSLQVHLHFQLQRTAAQTVGDNVPFEIDDFTWAGSFDPVEGLVSGPNAGSRADQMPLLWSVIAFPSTP